MASASFCSEAINSEAIISEAINAAASGHVHFGCTIASSVRQQSGCQLTVMSSSRSRGSFCEQAYSCDSNRCMHQLSLIIYTILP